MSASLAQYQFAAEFALYLVAVAGLALAALRTDVVTENKWARGALSFGFAALAGSAFIHGSLLRTNALDLLVVGPRAAGILLVAAGALAWRDRRSRWVLLAGVMAIAVGTVLSVWNSEIASAAARGIGAAVVGAALLVASRRAIAARVAATTAASVLLVVLVLSLGLSVVLQKTIEDTAISSVDNRARTETTAVEQLRAETIRQARLLEAFLIQQKDAAPQEDFASLIQAAGLGEPVPALADLIQTVSDTSFSRLPAAYASANGVRVATSGLGDADLASIVGSDVLKQTILEGTERGSVTATANRAFVTAAVAVRTEREGVVGAVIAATPLDRTYLLQRSQQDSGLSLALLSQFGEVASIGVQPQVGARAQLVRDVFDRGVGAVRVTDRRFISAHPIRASNGRTILVLIASTPTTSVDRARLQLFRTFFEIALGGALLALVLATVVGEQIGGGVRRLTIAAGAIQSGDLGVRTQIQSDDEVGFLSAAFDSMVSSLHENNAALAQAADGEARLRNRLEAVVAGMGEALIAVDESGTVSEFNAAAAELVGIDAAEARGRPLTEVLCIVAEDSSDLSPRLAEPGARRWSSLATLKTGAGTVPVAVTAGALRDAEGLSVGSVIVLRDLRGEQEVARMKRDFLSRVGHELRTPLTPIIGYAKLLASRDLPPAKVREVNATILELANRQFRIVEMVEFFASIEAGRDPMRVAPVDVAALLNDVVGKRADSAANHTITRRIRRGTPEVLADAHWLGRAVDELVDNAIKFSPTGGPIQVTAGPTADLGQPAVVVTVADRGTGMSPEQLDEAFVEFTQGDESDTRAFGGLGLGLSLVRQVAERLGGRVTCETKVGRGSKFSILLPVVPTNSGHETRGNARSRRRPPRD